MANNVLGCVRIFLVKTKPGTVPDVLCELNRIGVKGTIPTGSKDIIHVRKLTQSREDVLKIDGVVGIVEDNNLVCEVGSKRFYDGEVDNLQFGEFIRGCLGFSLSSEDSRGRKSHHLVEKDEEAEKPIATAEPYKEKDLIFDTEEKEVIVDGKKQTFPVKIYRRNNENSNTSG
jgi:hypothetical protein